MAENCPNYRGGKCDNPTDPRQFDCSWRRPDYERCSVYVLITDPDRRRRQLLAGFCGGEAGVDEDEPAAARSLLGKKAQLWLLFVAVILA